MEYIVLLVMVLIGSFLNVCIHRIPRKESIAYPPSHCTSCNTKLKPWDLVPVVSFMLSKGKCRYCGEKISLQYPLIELLTGLVGLALYLKFGFTLLFAKYVLLSWLLIVISFIDLEHQIIPNRLIVVGLILGLIFNSLYTPFISFLNGTMGLILGGGLFLLIAMVTGGAMGGGDIKLMGVLGFLLGWRAILMVTFLSFIVGATVSTMLLVLKIKGRRDYIPFGPFIAIATFITLYYGQTLIQWYITQIIY